MPVGPHRKQEGKDRMNGKLTLFFPPDLCPDFFESGVEEILAYYDYLDEKLFWQEKEEIESLVNGGIYDSV